MAPDLGGSKRPEAIAALAWIGIAAGLALRVVHLVRTYGPPTHWAGDAIHYQSILKSMTKGEWDSSVWIWMPGYAVSALPFTLLFEAGHALVAASLAFSVIPVAFFWRIASRTAYRVQAAVATVVLMFHPELVRASTRPASESVAVGWVILLGVATVAAVALRVRRTRLAVVAGVLAGLATLTRPEIAFLALPLSVVFIRRSWKQTVCSAGGYVLAMSVLVGFFVVKLHEVSGVWALSLKPQYNLVKHPVYARSNDYLEKRLAFERELLSYQETDGSWDVEKLAHAGSPFSFVRNQVSADAWIKNVAGGLVRMDTSTRVLVIAALVGLVRTVSAKSLPSIVAMIGLAPVLISPLFAMLFGRFVLPLVPSLAWGIGGLLGGGPALLRRVGLIPLVGSGVLAAAGAWTVASESHLNLQGTRVTEIRVLALLGRFQEAERTARYFCDAEPRGIRYWRVLADVLGAHGRHEESVDALVAFATREVLGLSGGFCRPR